MQNVLADLCIESEAATVAMMRLARAYDEAPETSGSGSSRASPRRSSSTGCASASRRSWPRRSSASAATAYVEESILPRLYREAPLNSLWEGSGNVICLDVLRAMGREPESVEAFFAEIDAGARRRRAPRRLRRRRCAAS